MQFYEESKLDNVVANELEGLARGFEDRFGDAPKFIFEAPGRSELGGNHTDHQHGHVLACAVDLKISAAVSPNNGSRVNLYSVGYDPIEVNLASLGPEESEVGTSASLIRGIAAKMCALGALPTNSSGFDAYVASNVPEGSGLSSSAAFEVLIGTIFNVLFCNGCFSPLDIAKIGQYAENAYFGKPCGLMDQAASAIGGVVSIDFHDATNPKVKKIDFDFEEHGYALCMIDSHASHADLTEEYASITTDMRNIATYFGCDVLSEVPEDELVKALPEIRSLFGDRAILRAMHFYADDKRAMDEADALEKGDIVRFLSLVRESGVSSAMFLQNIYPTGATSDQSLMLTIALAERLLSGRGAVRVHGGGFGGTAQAYVPLDMLEDFKLSIEDSLGNGSCHVLRICPDGATFMELGDAE